MRHDDFGDRELRARLSELADAAGRAAAMPSPTGARRRSPRGRAARRATAALAVLLGALAGPAAVGAGLVSFSTDGSSRPARTSPPPTAPSAGSILPPAPMPPRAPLGPGPPPSTAAEPSAAPQQPSRGASGPPNATPVPPATPPQGIWLSDGKDRDGAGCARPAPARRTIDAYYPAMEALQLVLAGPGPNEASRGLRSAPALAGLTIRTYGVVGRTARVDFDPLPDGAALPPRPCREVELVQPMERTLLQFANISEVRYSINGSEAAFYRDLIGIDVPDR